MSKFKLDNKIFNLGLNAKELSIYAYLCSLPSDYPMFDGTAIKVKQVTIAQKCGIKAVQTVAKVIDSLAAKGLVVPIKRSIKANGYKGTYIYELKKLPTSDSFFFVDRSVFGKLVPRQLMIYLFICKSFSMQLKDCWNSYISTKMSNISGISTNDNVQKTMDLYLKTQYLDEITGSKGVIFATGTPVATLHQFKETA